MGRYPKHHLARECSLKVRLPGPPLKTRHLRAALTSKEKSHLILCETMPFPVGAEIAWYLGFHKNCTRPGNTEPCA